MSDVKIIKQGNTGTLYKIGVVGDPDLSAGGPDYTCQIKVPTAEPVIDRAVTTLADANTRFAVQLTPAETDTLAPNYKHVLYVQIENLTLTPVFRVEKAIEFWVERQAIT